MLYANDSNFHLSSQNFTLKWEGEYSPAQRKYLTEEYIKAGNKNTIVRSLKWHSIISFAIIILGRTKKRDIPEIQNVIN